MHSIGRHDARRQDAAPVIIQRARAFLERDGEPFLIGERARGADLEDLAACPRTVRRRNRVTEDLVGDEPHALDLT